jgi:hypothetical protein
MRYSTIALLVAGSIIGASSANANSDRNPEIPDAVYAAALDRADHDHGMLQRIYQEHKNGEVFYRALIVLSKRSEAIDFTSKGELYHGPVPFV